MPSVARPLEHEDGKIIPKVLSFEARHRTDLEKSKEAELEVRPLVPCLLCEMDCFKVRSLPVSRG